MFGTVTKSLTALRTMDALQMYSFGRDVFNVDSEENSVQSNLVWGIRENFLMQEMLLLLLLSHFSPV